MTVPLLTTDRTLGTLNFSSKKPNAFENRERDLAIQAASLISNVVENRNLFKQTRLRARREQALRQITTRVRTFVEPDMILRTAARELGETLGRNVMIKLETNQTDGQASDDDQAVKPATSQESNNERN
jgi:GAF domain-containing protein